MFVAATMEPEIAILLRQNREQRLEGMRTFVRMPASNEPLRDGLDVGAAAETMRAIIRQRCKGF
jgi:hypothetical protein